MSRKDAVKLTKRVVEALSVEKKDRLFWVGYLTGFGVRVHATDRKVYVAQARPPGGGPKRVSVGRHGEISAEMARRMAAGIIDRIRQGEEPVPPPEAPEPTVADLAARYLEAHVAANCGAGIRLLLLTGCRKNDILSLRWDRVDLEAKEIELADSKTGPRTASLSPTAVGVLASVPRVAGNPYVIPGRRDGTHMCNLDDPWRTIRKRAGLDGLRLHDCRHSFASRALALGESLPMIGRLLGHSRVETTARYAHLAKDSVREAASRIADSIAADVLGGYPCEFLAHNLATKQAGRRHQSGVDAGLRFIVVDRCLNVRAVVPVPDLHASPAQ